MALSDELTTTISDALGSLPLLNKASFLLDTALALIEAGKCVEPPLREGMS